MLKRDDNDASPLGASLPHFIAVPVTCAGVAASAPSDASDDDGAHAVPRVKAEARTEHPMCKIKSEPESEDAVRGSVAKFVLVTAHRRRSPKREAGMDLDCIVS